MRDSFPSRAEIGGAFCLLPSVKLPEVGAPLPVLRPAAAARIDVQPEELISRWLAALSPTARRSYRRSLSRFAVWALADDAEPVAALRLLCGLDVGQAGELVRAFRDDLLASGLASGSVAGYCTGICSLLAACRRAGLVSWRLEGVQPRVEQRHDRSGPRRGDVERLFATIDDEAAAGRRGAVRDAALLRVLYVAALRRAEATGLRWPEDVDLRADGDPVVRPRRKGRKERTAVLVSQRCAEAIARWVAVRGEAPGFLFVGVQNGDATRPMNGESIRRIVARWARKAGLRGAIRPHGLRHSAATEVARRGSLAQLMALGGWSSMSAARRYLDDRQEERQGALALVDL